MKDKQERDRVPPKGFLHQTESGSPIAVGNYRIIPVSRAYRVTLPRAAGSLVWNRPLAARIERDGESDLVIPIHDVTRIAQVRLIAGSLITAAVLWAILHLPGKIDQKKEPFDG